MDRKFTTVVIFTQQIPSDLRGEQEVEHEHEGYRTNDGRS